MINYWQRFILQNLQIFKNHQNYSSQIKTSQSLDIPVLEIAKLIICQIVIF